jgi:tetratricopeptide (TPR) repeat protein
MTLRANGMKSLLAFGVAILATLGDGWSQESELQFIDGLRERGYYDTAIEYLDQLETASALSPESREILDLERGITWQQRGAASRIPEDRDQYLGQSEKALRKFLTEHAGHDQAAFANATLGQLLFDRARTLIWQADSESAADKRLSLQNQARTLIDKAEAIYEKARNQYLTLFEAFPTYIDAAREPDQFGERKNIENKYLRAWYNLSRCSFERGLTYDKGSRERKETLIAASTLFEEIYNQYRTVPIGMHARLMMGRCFQEHDDVGRALGLYQEYVGSRSNAAIAKEVRSVAQHYRMICLNHPDRASHELVLQEATEWLQTHKSELGTIVGLGILWEKAIAEEKLAAVRTSDPTERELLLRQALQDSQLVARYPGAFREPANALNRRVKAMLGDKDKEPRDFETAFERARGMIDQIQQLKVEIEAASKDAVKKEKSAALTLHMNEAGRLFQLALDLRDENTNAEAVAHARYLLSYVFFSQRKNFDAVIMSRFCMVHDRAADPENALNATEIAISAAVQAWNDAPELDREFETLLLRDVCQEIIDLYPQSTRGNEARIRLGRVYQQQGNSLEAAKWFLAVPEPDPQYASARISAGQQYWTAWTSEASGVESGRAEQHTVQEMQNWKKEAQSLLASGIELSRKKTGPDAPPPSEVIAAEVSMASILNLDGNYSETITRLTSGGDNSVVKAIAVADSGDRPKTGIQSASFAGLTLRLLMRAYVGTQQIDEAIATMNRLEDVGGQDTTAVYTQLGIELQEELRRLRSAGQTDRLTQVRNSFEQFLEKVYEQRDPSDYNSLLWIGETYFGLGQGVSDNIAAAAAYYDKAATAYKLILDGNLADGDTQTAIQLRLARCRRAQSMFEKGLQITLEILRSNPMALDAQFEAARMLSDWGSAGTPEKLLEAIKGIKEGDNQRIVWGWADMSKRLQQSLNEAPSPEFTERMLDARFELSNSRLRYAMANGPDSPTHLKAGLAEITIFAQVYRGMDDAWWGRFDQLFQDLQTQLGQVPVPLERPTAIQAAVAAPPKISVEDTATTETQTPVVAADPKSGGILLPLFAVCLAAGAAGGVYFMMNKPTQRRKMPGIGGSPFDPSKKPDSAAMAAAATSGGKQRPARTKSTAPAASSSPASSDVEQATRPAGRPGDGRRRRPKPAEGEQQPTADKPRRPQAKKRPPGNRKRPPEER